MEGARADAVPLALRAGRARSPIAHLEDPERPRRALCGSRLKRAPAPPTDACAVCLEMSQYGRFAGR